MQVKLEEANKTILRLSNSLVDIEKQYERNKVEIANTNATLNYEKMRNEKSIDELSGSLREKELELKRTSDNLNHIIIHKDRLHEDNNKMFSELEYLRSQVTKLTSTNNLVIFV